MSNHKSVDLIYLASPYSGTETQQHDRFIKICKIAAKLMNDGIMLYSPIAHTHPIAMAGRLPTGWEFWQKYDRTILSRCDELWVCMIDGWKESKGIAAEIKIAEEFDLIVRFIED